MFPAWLNKLWSHCERVELKASWCIKCVLKHCLYSCKLKGVSVITTVAASVSRQTLMLAFFGTSSLPVTVNLTKVNMLISFLVTFDTAVTHRFHFHVPGSLITNRLHCSNSIVLQTSHQQHQLAFYSPYLSVVLLQASYRFRETKFLT